MNREVDLLSPPEEAGFFRSKFPLSPVLID